MKKIIIYLLPLLLIVTACERDLDSEGIPEGEIRFPSIIVLGNNPIVQVSGSGFDDPGAQAFLGTDEITEQLQVNSNVETDVAGVYSVAYSVSTTNILGNESVANSGRTVVITSEDVSGVDLSGNYLRDNNAANPVVTATKVADGVYDFPNAFGSGTIISGFRFYHIGGNDIVAPIQNSQFGRLQGSGSITVDGFEYSLEFLDPPNTGFVLSRTFVKQ